MFHTPSLLYFLACHRAAHSSPSTFLSFLSLPFFRAVLLVSRAPWKGENSKTYHSLTNQFCFHEIENLDYFEGEAYSVLYIHSRMKFSVPRSEISFIPRTKSSQGPKENNCFPGLEKDNFRGHTPESVSDLILRFSGYTS
jgi:hypothetical protein